jgi:ABC-type uncharacterized transport system permease subunit
MSALAETIIFIFGLVALGYLAGLAGLFEVAGPVGQLVPVISPGYGFTAIIVAFLGRLNPLGILFAGFVMALTYIGGEMVLPERYELLRRRYAAEGRGPLHRGDG